MDVYPGICHYFGFNTNISLTTYGKDGNEFLAEKSWSLDTKQSRHTWSPCHKFNASSQIRTCRVHPRHGCQPLPHQFFIKKMEIRNSYISLPPWRNHRDTRRCSRPAWTTDRRRCGNWSHYGWWHIRHLPWTPRCHPTTDGDKRELN